MKTKIAKSLIKNFPIGTCLVIPTSIAFYTIPYLLPVLRKKLPS